MADSGEQQKSTTRTVGQKRKRPGVPTRPTPYAVPESVRKSEDLVRCKGAQQFRYRLLCAVLASRPVNITEIRSNSEEPGVRDYEASFLRLLEKITTGSTIAINETGTSVHFRPGVLRGGKGLRHECPTSRSIGYFLEALIQLCPFAKLPTVITLTGITNNNDDLSVDTIRTVTLPFLSRFGFEDATIQMKVIRRGAPPKGGGEVQLIFEPVRRLTPVLLTDVGKISRIRGIAYAARVSPQAPNRVIDCAKGKLLKHVHDVYLYSDHFKGVESGLSPGFGLCLVAETTAGCVKSAELMAKPRQMPEKLASKCVKMILHEAAHQGCIDSSNQSFAFLYMLLCSTDVSKIRLGKLTPYSIACLKTLYQFFSRKFKLAPVEGESLVDVSCLGIGYQNLFKKVT